MSELNEFKSLQDLLLKIDSRLCSLEVQFSEFCTIAKEEWAKLNQLTHNRQNRTIWTEKQIADYLQLSAGYVSVNVVTVEDFPKPITYGRRSNVKGKKASRRYFAGEVIAYFEDKERVKQTLKIKRTEELQDIQALSKKAHQQAMQALRGIR